MSTHPALGRRRALAILIALALAMGLLSMLAPGSFAAFQDCGANSDATARTNQSNAPRVAGSNTGAQLVQADAENEIENEGGDDEGGDGDGDNALQVVVPILSPVVVGDGEAGIFGVADDFPDGGEGGEGEEEEEGTEFATSPVVVQSNLNDSIVAGQDLDQEVDPEQTQVNAVELGPATQGSTSSPSNEETEGGECDFRQEQRTDTGDVDVEARSGDATGGDGGDSDGDVDISMATAGDGGPGGNVGGSGDYAGAIINSPHTKSGGGPGGPGGAANCTNCTITVRNDNRGGDGAGAESGSVEVNASSGDSGDNEFDAGRQEDRRERNDEGNDSDNSGDTGADSGPAANIGIPIELEFGD